MYYKQYKYTQLHLYLIIKYIFTCILYNNISFKNYLLSISQTIFKHDMNYKEYNYMLYVLQIVSM